jgi:hypothetical protein
MKTLILSVVTLGVLASVTVGQAKKKAEPIGRPIEVQSKFHSLDKAGKHLKTMDNDGNITVYSAARNFQLIVNGQPGTWKSISKGDKIRVLYVRDRIPDWVDDEGVLHSKLDRLVMTVIVGSDDPDRVAEPSGPPQLAPHNLEVGKAGVCNYQIRIVQVIDAENMLARFGNRTVWIKGYSTKDVTEGEDRQFGGVMKVSGTKQYETALGVSKTVLLIEPETDQEKKDREDKERKAGAERARKRAAQAGRREQADAADKMSADKGNAVEDAQKKEAVAKAKLAIARELIAAGKRDAAREHLKELIDRYPGTAAARAAQELRDKLKSEP